MEIVEKFGGMLLRENVYFPDLHVCILICFKVHKLYNNTGLKPSQRAVVIYCTLFFKITDS